MSRLAAGDAAEPVRWPLITVAVLVSMSLHAGGLVAVKGRGLLGAGDLDGLLGPPSVRHRERVPLRLKLGAAEPAPAEGPGPRGVLDPQALRRPPGLPDSGAEARWADHIKHLAQSSALGPLEHRFVRRPQPARAGTADEELAAASIRVEVKLERRPLPRRFIEPPSLARAAEGTRPGPEDEAARFKPGFPPGSALIPSDLLYEPARPLRVPEVFVDVLGLAGP